MVSITWPSNMILYSQQQPCINMWIQPTLTSSTGHHPCDSSNAWDCIRILGIATTANSNSVARRGRNQLFPSWVSWRTAMVLMDLCTEITHHPVVPMAALRILQDAGLTPSATLFVGYEAGRGWVLARHQGSGNVELCCTNYCIYLYMSALCYDPNAQRIHNLQKPERDRWVCALARPVFFWQNHGGTRGYPCSVAAFVHTSFSCYAFTL